MALLATGCLTDTEIGLRDDSRESRVTKRATEGAIKKLGPEIEGVERRGKAYTDDEVSASEGVQLEGWHTAKDARDSHRSDAISADAAATVERRSIEKGAELRHNTRAVEVERDFGRQGGRIDTLYARDDAVADIGREQERTNENTVMNRERIGVLEKSKGEFERGESARIDAKFAVKAAELGLVEGRIQSTNDIHMKALLVVAEKEFKEGLWETVGWVSMAAGLFSAIGYVIHRRRKGTE